MSKLRQAVDKTVNWLRLNYPENIEGFRQGLSIEEIQEITKDFPFVIPKEIVELYQIYDGDIMFGSWDLTLYSLESALEWSPHWEGYKYPPSSENHILTIMHGSAKNVYYVLCDKEDKDSSPIWYTEAGGRSIIYASSFTNLMLTVAECYETGAYYTALDSDGFLEIKEDLDKFEKIFEKYNPEQIDTWRQNWRD
jgi:cell wall assembly regulator SMI1